MATLDARYRINGIIDTARPVFENLETVTNSCATWLSYDGIAGKWSVVINQPSDPVATLDDDSIIGGITLSTSNLADVYNECEVRFHNQELRDQEDYVLLAIPSNQRLPNEPTNRMVINAPMVNNQIQAQLIGLIELKQSRLSDTIEFETDYSLINLEAGDVIEITNSVYGWTNREFRVLRITESESEGSILIRITAQAYSDSVYDTSDLREYVRETETGLIELDPLKDVSAITANTAVLDENGNPMLGLLGANALIALLKGLMEDDATGSGSLFDQIFEVFAANNGYNPNNGGAGQLQFTAQITTAENIALNGDSNLNTVFLTNITTPLTGLYKVRYFINWGGSGNPGVNGILKTSAINIPGKSLGEWASTGDLHVQLYEDHLVEALFVADAGESLTLNFQYRTDWPTAAVWILAEVLVYPGFSSY